MISDRMRTAEGMGGVVAFRRNQLRHIGGDFTHREPFPLLEKFLPDPGRVIGLKKGPHGFIDQLFVENGIGQVKGKNDYIIGEDLKSQGPLTGGRPNQNECGEGGTAKKEVVFRATWEDRGCSSHTIRTHMGKKFPGRRSEEKI